MPVLLIRGARTSDLFNKTMSVLGGCLPYAREVVIANAGHCSPCDNPVEFNRVALEFLQATAAPRGGRGVH